MWHKDSSALRQQPGTRSAPELESTPIAARLAAEGRAGGTVLCVQS